MGLAAGFTGVRPQVLGTNLPALKDHVVNATRIYSRGNYIEITAFRWHETQQFIAPLLIGSAQRTFGLMLLGVALWRFGIIGQPDRYRSLLWATCIVAGTIGLLNTTAHLMHLHVQAIVDTLGSDVLLAFAYAAALLAWRPSPQSESRLAPVAAAGRMALSNYLTQSILFAIIFYGYGFGLFGHLAPAPAAALGITVYLAQLWFSTWWLHRYRFGPFEWLWRSLTYGRRQPMHHQRSAGISDP